MKGDGQLPETLDAGMTAFAFACAELGNLRAQWFDMDMAELTQRRQAFEHLLGSDSITAIKATIEHRVMHFAIEKAKLNASIAETEAYLRMLDMWFKYRSEYTSGSDHGTQ